MATNATNTNLTPDMITAKALVILHQKLNFVGSINRQYDSSFAQEGAKIGTALRIRLPVQYSVRTGANLSVQNSISQNVSLTVNTQMGVDLSFSSNELTMTINDFAALHLEPAMAVLAANIESNVISNVVPAVYNQVNGMGAAQSFRNLLQARKVLLDNLTPQSKRWMARITTTDNVDLVDSLKGLLNPGGRISNQYTEGVMGEIGNFEVAENTFLGNFTPGARNTAYVLNGVPASGATTAVVATGSGAMVVGDVFTMAGVNRVHPETKASTGVLQQFVVTAAYAGGAGTISFSPALNYTANAQQNVAAAPASNAALTFAGTLSTAYGNSVVYHPDFATFATADLVMPGGVDMASRAVKDGISIRLVRQYDINNDFFPCRLDVLFGSSAIRPQLACRIAAN